MSKGGLSITKDITASVKAALAAMTKKHVLVGIPMEKAGRDGDAPIDNAAIGYINEKGSAAANVPPRPHLEPGVLLVKDRAAKLMGDGAAAAFGGDSGAIEAGMNKAGLVAVSSVRAVLTQGEGFAALSEVTLENRAKAGFKGTKPLIWTGQYRNSISYVIRDK